MKAARAPAGRRQSARRSGRHRRQPSSSPRSAAGWAQAARPICSPKAVIARNVPPNSAPPISGPDAAEATVATPAASTRKAPRKTPPSPSASPAGPGKQRRRRRQAGNQPDRGFEQTGPVCKTHDGDEEGRGDDVAEAEQAIGDDQAPQRPVSAGPVRACPPSSMRHCRRSYHTRASRRQRSGRPEPSCRPMRRDRDERRIISDEIAMPMPTPAKCMACRSLRPAA